MIREPTGEFRVRAYGRTELAVAYCPNITPDAAWEKLKQWIAYCPGLAERLAEAGYRPQSRAGFTPRQVGLIVEALGEP